MAKFTDLPMSFASQDFLEPSARNVPDLLERVCQFGIGLVAKAPLHLGHDTRPACMQRQRHNAGKTKTLAVAAIQFGHPLEMASVETQEAETVLFAG